LRSPPTRYRDPGVLIDASGSTVIITAYKRGCNAIALIAGLGEPLHIPLPDLTIEKASDYRAILNKKVRSGPRFRDEGESDDEEGETEKRGVARFRRGGEKDVLYVLKALWVEMVKPILDALAIPVSFMYGHIILFLTLPPEGGRSEHQYPP
jgi:hypothetical protein